jgi:hypothetical protein
MDLLSYCHTKFAGLPESKQAPYKEKFAQLTAEYKEKIKDFYALYPQLNPKKVKAKKARKEKKQKAPKPERVPKEKPKPTFLSPFTTYRESVPDLAYAEAQKLWKDLHAEEKCKFIKEVANLDTRVEDSRARGSQWPSQEATERLPAFR